MQHVIVVIMIVSLAVLAACSNGPQAEEPVSTPTPVIAVEAEIDPLTGFKMSGDWELVRGNCTSCHSAKLITQQRGTSQQWLTMIRWMQKKQNLWQFDPDTESRIIAYLSANYPPEAGRRRAAIPPDLMPPNPYATEISR